ncbi:MAG: hypothetical protein PHG60_01620 [Candidatus Dojkabacteria bacterium]|jgi:uridylate kinase|nr:hypothetical protein [Candidatus Dojkabacteria bacterium]MDD2270261.1 hypothetical protein [Candidatus Dojkabacteria bacterium]
MDKNVLVLKVGGSIMYDQLLNVNFEVFKKIKVWYHEQEEKYDKIVFVTGGGGLSRSVQESIIEDIGGEDNFHSIAMSVTQTNAAIFSSYLDDKQIFVPRTLGEAYEFLIDSGERVMVSGGLKMGWSTDMDAAVFADTLGTDRVFKISNIDYVYDKDPKEFFDAKPIKDMTWKDYFKIFDIVEGEQHGPNRNMPISVESAQYCARKKISFLITGGKFLEEEEKVSKILQKGTFIHP